METTLTAIQTKREKRKAKFMQKPSVVELFFALVQCGIGKREKLPCAPSPEEWEEIFDIAQKQTMAGITFAAVEKLPKEQLPPRAIVLKWYGIAEIIKKKNIELNKKCAIVSEKFNKEGFRNCILKGQGIARLYPNPLFRTPGDIDIWLEGGADKILAYVRRFIKESKPVYHHVDFPIAKDLDIEIHFTPSWMYSPVGNKRLQNFFKEKSDSQYRNTIETNEGCFPAPTLEFNRIYILLHIYRHLFQEGIGLRQMLDYNFVLSQGFTQEEREESVAILKKLNLTRFASAAMYVLQTIFLLEEKHLLVPANRKDGEFLLNEIMTAGNFGKYDKRYDLVSKENEAAHFANSMKRILRLFSRYTSETLWSPYFKVRHYFWRKKRERTN